MMNQMMDEQSWAAWRELLKLTQANTEWYALLQRWLATQARGELGAVLNPQTIGDASHYNRGRLAGVLDLAEELEAQRKMANE